ncbi:MAG: DUF1934 domain-containing protein [Ruminococcaceae bacterium]|nr:DUF1934 domain-containing protein [Oscillospiraceae bacterium]
MNKDVLITIHSIQNIDGQDCDGPELITQGTYEYAPDGVRFSYMESELTGLEGTRTDFHIKPEEVVLSRRGSVNAEMVFRRGEKQRFRYQTEYGALNLALNTHRLETTLDEHGGDVEIEYDLNFNQSFLSRNRFIINVKEKGLKS